MAMYKHTARRSYSRVATGLPYGQRPEEVLITAR
jgi:hypothetical protein